MLDADGRFSKNFDYLLAAQYASEQKAVSDQVNIILRQVKGNRITASTVKDKPKLGCTGMIKLINHLSQFAVVQVIGQKRDLMAMIRQLGKPTFFLILSAADMQWENPISAIGKQYGKYFSADDVANMSWEERSNWIRLLLLLQDVLCHGLMHF